MDGPFLSFFCKFSQHLLTALPIMRSQPGRQKAAAGDDRAR
jgi:hypothetical protein